MEPTAGASQSRGRGFIRVLLLTAIALALLFHNYPQDTSSVIWLYSLGVAILLAAGSHLTRRVLFHRLDLQAIALDAIKTRNWQGTVIFVTICAVIVSLMWIPVAVVR